MTHEGRTSEKHLTPAGEVELTESELEDMAGGVVEKGTGGLKQTRPIYGTIDGPSARKGIITKDVQDR